MFFAYVKQEEVGCYFTIGCGRTLWKLSATTRLEAVKELQEKIIGKYVPERGYYEEGFWGEDKLRKVILLEVASEKEMPVEQWYVEASLFLMRKKLMKMNEQN